MTVQGAEIQLPYPGDDPSGIGALTRGLKDARAQLTSFDSEISTARARLGSWRAAEAQAADARATRLTRNGQLVGAALDSAASAVGSYADSLTTARIGVDGLRDEWATASKQLNALLNVPDLPAEELAVAQAKADKFTDSLNEITDRYNRLVARVAESVATCRKALGNAAQAASDTDSDQISSLAGGLPSSVAADVAALIAAGSLPPEAAGMTLTEFISHAESDWALQLDKGLGLPLPRGSLLNAAMVDGIDLSTGMTIATTTADSLAAAFATMSPDERTWMAVLYPRYLGSRDGVPFETRAQANRVMISAELTREQGTLTERLALDAEAQRDKGFWDMNIFDDDDQDQLIADSRAKIELYQHLLDDRVVNDRAALPGEPATIARQILSFDASRNGEFAELVGTIDEKTKNVGVLVPGTNTTLMGAQGGVDRVGAFVERSKGQLAMIYWAAGAFPQNAEAALGRFNDQLAPDLVDFTAAVNRTVDATGADIPITVAGHSYGGATVGTAEPWDWTLTGRC
ncbi:MAG: alpha/beta hydrolase [Nakamurella sp.]